MKSVFDYVNESKNSFPMCFKNNINLDENEYIKIMNHLGISEHDQRFLLEQSSGKIFTIAFTGDTPLFDTRLDLIHLNGKPVKNWNDVICYGYNHGNGLRTLLVEAYTKDDKEYVFMVSVDANEADRVYTKLTSKKFKETSMDIYNSFIS